MTFQDLGLDENFNLINSPTSQTSNALNALEQDLLFELNPFAQPNFISKGSVNTISGGILTLFDKTGGTKVLTYNPATGVITILGTLNVQNSSTGTYTNIVVAGTSTVTGTLAGGIYTGTLNNSVIGTPTVTGGTVNAGSYAVGGVAGFTGTGTYVKTVNFAGSTTTLGSIISTNGIITSIS